MRRSRHALALVALLLLAACGDREAERGGPPETPPPDGAVSLAPASFADLAGWTGDDVAGALTALRRTCAAIIRRPADEPLGRDRRFGRVGDWQPACAAADGVTAAKARGYFESHFRPVRLDGAESGLFTGYYEPEIAAAADRDASHAVPLHGVPADLVTARLGDFAEDLAGRSVAGRVADGRLVPYPARAAIEDGGIDGLAPVLYWAADPVEAFILHIQGSGIVRLPDGRRQRIGFAASNGRPFVAVGRLMLERDLIGRGEAHMPAIRAWLRAHPDEARRLMRENPRYIFFRPVEGDGPVGAAGVALTAGRSLAVDTAHVPLGVPLWLDTTWPGDPARPLRRLVVAQDRGAAIVGPIRGDLFWGTGDAAFERAGRMKSSGTYFPLLPRAVVEALAATE